MVFIILQGCFPCSNVSIIRECECTNGMYGSYYATNILYHLAMPSLSWLSPKVENVWNVCKSNARWWKILQRGWHSHLPFHAKMESHDWWASIRFSLKETRTRVRHLFLLHHSIGGQYT